MLQRLFISYNKADSGSAMALCDLLERRGIPCWVAPRDIPAGADWPEAVMEAVADCSGLVLLLSSNSAQSDQVPNEVTEGFALGKRIYPLRLEEVEAPARLRYFLGRKQWVDAFDRPLADAAERLIASLGPTEGTGQAGRPTFRDLPIVDRVTARARLQELAGIIGRDGRGMVVLVEGTAGVGKTRLMEWCEGELAPAFGARAVWGKHTVADAPWEGMRQVLEELFGVTDAPRSVVEERVRERLSAWGGADDEEVALLSGLIRPSGGAPSGALDAGGARVMECLGRAVRRFARERPLMVVLEDVHWADEQSVAFIEYMASSLEHRAVKLLLLATLREEDLAANQRLAEALSSLTRYAGRTFERLRLENLDAGNARALIEEALPGGLDLSGHLAECADGCPLYILEILRHLFERGLIERDGERWQVADGVDLAAEIPGSLAGLVRNRIDRLTRERPWLDVIVTYAAAAGLEFDLEVLAAALERGGERQAGPLLEEGLEALEEAGILRVVLAPASCRVSFAHDLVHRAVREARMGGLRGRLRARHIQRAIAEAKEEVYGGAIDEHAAEIAEHYELCGQGDRAADLYLRAAATSVRAFCYGDALQLYERASAAGGDPGAAVERRLAKMPPVDSEAFCEASSEVLGRCVAAALAARGAGSAWERATGALRAGLGGPYTDRLVTEAELALSFLTYVAQTRRRADLWGDITMAASIPLGWSEADETGLRKAQVLDRLGFVGESLARLTGEPNSGPECAREAADCYLSAYGQLKDRPAVALRTIEPASWCEKRAGRYEDALEHTREFMRALERCTGPEAGMRKAILAEGYRELAEDMVALKHRDPEREDLVRAAAENLRRAALQRLGSFPESWFARWTTRLAEELEETGDCDLDMAVDTSPGDVLLVHNRLDALAADVVRQHLRGRGLRCVGTGPDDPRGVAEMEAAYRHIVVFGSTVAPKMERFSYLFRGERDVWRLNALLSRAEPFYSSWSRPKGNGEGSWILVAGSTRIDTILAAGAFRLEGAGG